MNKTLKDEKLILQGSKKSLSNSSKRSTKKARAMNTSTRQNFKKQKFFSDETLDLFSSLSSNK